MPRPCKYHRGDGDIQVAKAVGAAESLAPAKDVEGSGGEGVVVLNVDPSSPAAQVGVQSGDVILNASGKTVQTPEDVR